MTSISDFFTGLYDAIKEIFTHFIGETNSVFNSLIKFFDGLIKGNEE